MSVPRLSNTASAAVAAAVVAGAAALTSLGPGLLPEQLPVTIPTGARGALGGATVPGTPASATPAVDTAAATSVLFVGRSPDLKPRGGVARSFACRAAVELDWACHVHLDLTRAVPSTLAVDVVVITLVPRDDAARVARLLDGLPPAVAAARMVFLEPVVPGTDRASTRRLAGIRRLVAARGGLTVDPVRGQWLAGPEGRTYLTPDGGTLTAAGHTHVAERLADALTDLGMT